MTNQPLLTFHSHNQEPWFGSVSVCNLDPNLVASLGNNMEPDHQLRSIFRVRILQSELPENGGLPDIFGRYQILDNGVRFVPHFPFQRGVNYHASFDPQPLGGSMYSEVQTLEFSLPKEPGTAPTQVTHIYPSSDSLPENLLRFYVCFSGSMQRGRCEQEIALLGSDGQPVPDVLYRPPVELWDRNMRCLTVLLDPGRLKRGVGPNVALGPPLKMGQEYTLLIGSGMVDVSGRPLPEAFRKRFRVTEAVREPISVAQWQIAPPAAASRQPLVLNFPRPLDWAILLRAMTITSTDGQLIHGCVVIDQCETRWNFTPTSPWAAGSYLVCVESSLEDICGNTITAAFDGPLRSKRSLANEPSHRLIAFHLT
ncbi:MAG TPA: hypothetical protein VMG59_09050 [Phycisphaerae bacterium]|nr:hypothetical protein [Phycisphaerae bacterium]